MEEDKIKDLFRSFSPELSPDGKFLANLKRNIAAVEMVRQYSNTQHRLQRTALAISAFSGFLAGVIFTILYPLIGRFMSSAAVLLHRIGISAVDIDCKLVLLPIIGALCVFTALNVYEIALFMLKKKKPSLIHLNSGKILDHNQIQQS